MTSLHASHRTGGICHDFTSQASGSMCKPPQYRRMTSISNAEDLHRDFTQWIDFQEHRPGASDRKQSQHSQIQNFTDLPKIIVLLSSDSLDHVYTNGSDARPHKCFITILLFCNVIVIYISNPTLSNQPLNVTSNPKNITEDELSYISTL